MIQIQENSGRKVDLIILYQCPYEIQNHTNWYKLVGKENQLEGLSRFDLPLLDLLLRFAFFGFSVQGIFRYQTSELVHLYVVLAPLTVKL